MFTKIFYVAAAVSSIAVIAQMILELRYIDGYDKGWKDGYGYGWDRGFYRDDRDIPALH